MTIRTACLVFAAALLAAGAGCGDDSETGTTSGTTSSGGDGGMDGGGGSPGTGGEGGAPVGETLCTKYGGAANVATVVQTNVVGAIAADCRINNFFLTLETDALTHVSDCLTTQVQELFGCEGVVYEGSMSSVGRECRNMVDAHVGLGITDDDFNALLEDAVAGMTEAGVEEADINAAAPALLGMHDDIVTSEDAGNSQDMCEGSGGGGGAGGG